MTTPLLSVKDLVIEFNTDRGLIRAVDRISFDIFEGETVGLVGESGCGKSITSLSILGLIPSPPGRIGAGSSIKYQGKELVGLPEEQLRLMRGHDISMIFQEPMTALNPVFTVGNQMMEVIMRHKKVNKKEALKMAIKMLEDVGIPAPEKRVHNYPHQMSGGMRQRVMIAMALSCNPHLLLADEPTTALDVTIQAQVMDLMGDMQKKQNMAVILVTHDLGVVAEFCQRVIVMYCGHIAEVGTVDQIFNHPQHPYTKGLLASIPRVLEKKVEFLPTIEGTVPDLGNLPAGCRFADRCERATEECNAKPPQLTIDEKTQAGVACYHPYK